MTATDNFISGDNLTFHAVAFGDVIFKDGGNNNVVMDFEYVVAAYEQGMDTSESFRQTAKVAQAFGRDQIPPDYGIYATYRWCK